MQQDIVQDTDKSHHQIHLLKERREQINRNGVPVAFYPPQPQYPYSYLVFHQNYLETVSKWIQSKYTINLYGGKYLKQICLLNKSNIFLQHNYLLMNEPKIQHHLVSGAVYYIAKNNATLTVLTSIFQELDKIEENINSFINVSAITQIPPNPPFEIQEWFYYNLNAKQRKAVDSVVQNRVSFIKGPPGCGKTRLIARLCNIFAYNGCRVLVGAVSNTANYSIAYSLLKQGMELNSLPNIVLYLNKEMSTENMLHPPEIRALTFRQKLIQNFLEINTRENICEQQLQYLLDSCWAGNHTNNTFLSIYYQAIAKTLEEASIVISTTISATKFDAKLAPHQKFYPNIAILDEASQSTWADTYCYLTKGPQKIVLVGDDKQLCPTVISQNQVLKETMFNDLKSKNPKYFTLLNIQYRMHPKISQFPNRYFYEDQLENGVSEQERCSHIPFFKDYPVSFINHHYMQTQQVDQNSGKKNYYNQKEVEMVLEILQMFREEDFHTIGIISPYDYQIRKIYDSLSPAYIQRGLTVRTCDGYQGGQKDYIIYTCVRSNESGKIGFCGQESRVNVSLTRAMRGLVVIGSISTLGQSGFVEGDEAQKNVWKQYIEYLKQQQLILKTEKVSEYKNNKGNKNQ